MRIWWRLKKITNSLKKKFYGMNEQSGKELRTLIKMNSICFTYQIYNIFYRISLNTQNLSLRNLL